MRLAMLQPITHFELDDEQHWRAILACGHRQHVRHEPPLMTRLWVLTAEGRAGMIGNKLNCLHCDADTTIPPDGRSG